MTASLDEGHDPWRSILFVPANVRRFVDRAHERGADAVELDLEDSVLVREKAEARRNLSGAIDRLAGFGVPIVVRVNRSWSLLPDDLRSAVRPDVSAIELPKVSDPSHVRVADEIVSELESANGLPPGQIRFILAVEDAAGVLAVPHIGAASRRTVALTLGAEDLAAQLGMASSSESIRHCHEQIVLAARANNLLPYGLVGSLADYSDTAAVRAAAQRSRAMGFVGASAIHPSQVAALNEAFGVSAEEVAQARRVVAAMDRAADREGAGAATLDGRMVDEAHARAARRLLRDAVDDIADIL
jgi:citrate lyase subunit beta / citryl-CoA lyase